MAKVEIKPGVKTSEFWIVLIPYVLLILKNVSGVELEADVIVEGILGLSAFIGSVTYIIGRIQLKTKNK